MSQSLYEKCVLGGFLLLCFAVAALGSLATTPAIDGWYATLRKPAWTPPNWVFGPVWSALYVSMAVAAWVVWRGNPWSTTRMPLFVFLAQLTLNLLWSIVFFGLRRPGLALLEILLLWGAIVTTLLAFRRLSPLAAVLLVPYLLWVTLAVALNFAIWRMNM